MTFHKDLNDNIIPRGKTLERVSYVSGGLHVDISDDGQHYPSASSSSSISTVSSPKGSSLIRRFSSSVLYQEELSKDALEKSSSLSYLPSYSTVYKSWLSRQKHRFLWSVEWDRWFLCFLIGLIVGLIAVLLNQCSTALGNVRLSYLKEHTRKGDLHTAWGWNILFTFIYIIIASFIVAYIQPLAAGGGTPEIIAYLNGIMVHGAISFRQLVTKFVALVFTVSAGFPVGTQGPLIVFGACVGSGIGQFRSRTFGIAPKLFPRFRNREDRRQFTTVGVAAGVSAGFDAPIGGLLIAMEDLASFWSRRLSWQTLFTCVVSLLTAKVFNTAFNGFQYRGIFGPFSSSPIEILNVHIAILAPAIVLGLVGGVVGAFFTRLSAFITSKRKAVLAAIKNEYARVSVRMLDALIMGLLVTSFATYLPNSYHCDTFSLSNHTTTHIRECYYQTINLTVDQLPLEKYNCEQEDLAPDEVNYNGVATLIQGGAGSIYRKLWERGNHWWYPWDQCLAVFIIWMLLNCYITSGCAVTGGIFVPCVVTGALYGRALGVGMMHLWVAVSGTDHPENSEWNWLDPGLIAVLGSASMLGGVTRLALATTLLMVEMSRDIELIIPILVTVLVARTVGEALSKSLFRYLIDGKSLPFLDQEPRVIVNDRIVNLELYTAGDVMASAPIVSIHSVISVAALAQVLRDTKHGGIPVVKYDKDTRTEHVYGLLTRMEIYTIILSEDVVQARTRNIIVRPKIDFDKLSIDYPGNTEEAEDLITTFCTNPSKYSKIHVDLDPFINRSVTKIDQTYSLHRTYQLFRTLGLRHLLVTDLHNKLVGIITRKDLMQFAMQKRLSNANPAVADNDNHTRLNLQNGFVNEALDTSSL